MGKFKLGGIVETSLIETDGVATVIFFQGCTRNCKNCHNPELQPVDAGTEVDVNDIQINWDWIDYVALSGGEPLLQIDGVKEFSKKAREKGKKVWLYTGYEFSEVPSDILECVDVIKTGGFVEELKSPKLKYRGSSNQKLHRKIDGLWEEFN
jgi:anaerobic ribonucleoside-triphosphate reductase activating protein